ncbi:hypothetical protein [Christensenella hongkongensis]|uniref:hypothetical protein n=1 Tax=Christensenella hongkongensis TaxID=270498 RepID=UPI001046FDA2
MEGIKFANMVKFDMIHIKPAAPERHILGRIFDTIQQSEKYHLVGFFSDPTAVTDRHKLLIGFSDPFGS